MRRRSRGPSSGLSIFDPPAEPATNDAEPPPAPSAAGVSAPRSRMRLRDLVDEAIMGIGSRPARLILTMIGTVVGIAALVATMGLSQSAAGQIAGRFDAVAATRLTVAPAPAPPGAPDRTSTATLPWDAAERIARLAGVAAAGTYTEVKTGQDTVSGVALLDPSGGQQSDIPVVAGSPGLLAAEGGTLATGRFFDAGHDARADRVAVLGSRAAQRLGINRVDSRPSIFLGEQSYQVIGIIDVLDSRDELQDAVIIPNATAARAYQLTGPDVVDVRTELGAAQQVAGQAAVAVAPNDPATVKVQAPPAPGRLGQAVGQDVNGLFLAFGGLALVVGGFGIANVTLLSVMERTGEIGLRRALGARRRHVAAQFLTESGVIGLLGGLIGTALGVLTVLGVAIARDWTPILDLRLALAAPAVGALIGILSGAYPSVKAAATAPIGALRQGS